MRCACDVSFWFFAVVPLVVVLLLVSLDAPVALGANVFVSSTSGNDTIGCGSTAGLACRSIPFASSVAVANDVVVLAANETFSLDNASVVIAHSLTFSGGPATVVRGSTAPFFVVAVAANSSALEIAFRGITFNGSDVRVRKVASVFNSTNAPLSGLSLSDCAFVDFSSSIVAVTMTQSHLPSEFNLNFNRTHVLHFSANDTAFSFISRTSATTIAMVGMRLDDLNVGFSFFSFAVGNATLSLADWMATNVTTGVFGTTLFQINAHALQLSGSDLHFADVGKVDDNQSVLSRTVLDLRFLGSSSVAFESASFQNVYWRSIFMERAECIFNCVVNVKVANASFVNDFSSPVCVDAVQYAQATFSKSGVSPLSNTLIEIADSHFEVGGPANVCETGGGFSSGGGFNALFKLPSIVDRNSIRVTNCTFVNLRSDTGGAISVARQSVCTSLDVIDCRFHGNSAIFSGGAISVVGSSPSHCDNSVGIQGSEFRANRAETGGAISITAVASDYIDGLSAMVIQDAVFSDNVASGGGDHVLLQMVHSLNTTNSTFLGSGRQPIMVVAGLGAGSGHILVNSTSVSCSPGEFVTVVKEDFGGTREVVYKGGRLLASCERCVGTYNLAGQTAMFGADGSLLAPVGAATGCFACPTGSRFNCSGAAVGSAPGFWATANATQVVEFLQCPPHYCCADERGCASIDACANNRSGVLCGACADGFVAGVAFHDKCIALTDCTSTRFGIASLVFLLGTAALTAYYFASNPGGDGMASVLLSFFNTATLLTAELARAGKEPASGFWAGFRSFVSLASGYLVPLGDSTSVCLTPTLSSLQRLLIPLAFTLAMLCWHCLFSVVLALVRRRRARTEAIPLNADDEIAGVAAGPARESVLLRVFSSLLMVLNFNLFIVVRVLVDLLVTVDVPGLGCRLWRAADQSCGGWQAGVGLALAATLLFPLLSELAVRWRKDSLLARAVLLVFRSPAADGAGAQSYHLASTVRRAVLALAASFVTNVELRLAAIRTILLVAAAWLAFVDTPFKSALVNRLEKSALLVALAVALTQSGESEPNGVLRGFQIGALVLMICALVAAMAITKIQRKLEHRRRRK
jgi:predicted outer membrane repeat protein